MNLLNPQEAFNLFLVSMGRSKNEDLVPGEQKAIERIINALECHTLAVRLAGAYAADLHKGLVTLAQELENPQRAIELPDGETPRAVALVFGQSTQALPADEQRLFATLAAFATTEMSRNAAISVAKDLGIAHPETSIDLLVRRALLDTFANERVSEGDSERLRLHILLHAFAAEHFCQWQEEERENAFFAVACYYAAYVNAVPDKVLGFDEANIAAAMRWTHDQGQDALGALLCTGMRYFWRDQWRTDAYIDYLPWGMNAAMRVAQETHERMDRLRAAYLALTYGQVLQNMGDLEKADEIFQVSATIFQDEQDRRGEGAVFLQLGQSERSRGNYTRSEQYLDESLVIARERQDRDTEASILSELSLLALLRGQFDLGEDYAKQALSVLGEGRNEGVESLILLRLGQIVLMRGKSDEANAYLQKGLPMQQRVYGRVGEVTTLAQLGQLAWIEGRFDDAERCLQESLPLARKIGDRKGEAISLFGLGLVALARGQFEEAERLTQEALVLARRVQDRGPEAGFLFWSAKIALARGQLDEAEKRFRYCLEISHDIQIFVYAPVALEFGTFLIQQRGKLQDGCAYLREALQHFEAMNLPNEAQQAREIAKSLGCIE